MANPATWTEADYAAAGYTTVKIRLKPDAAQALEVLSDGGKLTRTEVISAALLGAAKKATRARRKVPSKP